ncbi:MAG: M50 family metallopeptidase [Myxococcales bacterium]|nr:M50 family metallopeptidase [Myxococcales bacterium]
MFGRMRLGTLLGFPIELSTGFFLLLAMVFFWQGGAAGLLILSMAMVGVLLHELGHAVVARRLGVRIAGIELNFFGGAAKMMELPKSANHEIAIALAGPAVSVALAVLGFGLFELTAQPMAQWFGYINAALAIFNLIPALPMDGGRVLRALLTRKFDFVRATEVAVKVSRVFAIVLVFVAIGTGSWRLALIAPFLWFLGTAEVWQARAMAQRFAYDSGGYRARRPGEVEVLGRDGLRDADDDDAPLASPFGGGMPSNVDPRVMLEQLMRAGAAGQGHMSGVSWQSGQAPRKWTVELRNGRFVVVEDGRS